MRKRETKQYKSTIECIDSTTSGSDGGNRLITIPVL